MNPQKPLDQVKNYFGEQIGLYFAFIGYYTFWLTGIALFGLGKALKSHFSDCLLAVLLANEIQFLSLKRNVYLWSGHDEFKYFYSRIKRGF